MNRRQKPVSTLPKAASRVEQKGHANHDPDEAARNASDGIPSESQLAKAEEPGLEQDPDPVDELDVLEFDPTVGDFLGDFGLDDDEALPEQGDFFFDDAPADDPW